MEKVRKMVNVSYPWLSSILTLKILDFKIVKMFNNEIYTSILNTCKLLEV